MDPAAILGAVEIAGGIVGEVVAPLLMRLRFWIEDSTGWLNKSMERFEFAGVSTDMISLVWGLSLHDIIELTRFVTYESLNVDAVVGTRLGQMALSVALGRAVESSLRPVVQTISNIVDYYRGNRPTWAFNIIFMGNIFEYIDEDTLAYLMALGGENFFGTVSYLQQALGWLFDMDQHDVLAEVRRAVDTVNDAAMIDIDTYMDEARWFLSEGYRIYHRAFMRLLTIVDRIIERGVARLWELRVKLWTLYEWYKNGLITPERFARVLTQVQIEMDMTNKNVEDAMSIVEEVAGYIDFESAIDDLVSAAQRVAMVRYDIATKVINALGKAGYDQVMKRLQDAVVKLAAIRTRVAENLSLGVAPNVVGYTAPQPMDSIQIIDLYGEDL